MRGYSHDSKPDKEFRNNKQTHLLGLSYVLDKYQHQNSMLSQEIKLLQNQNRILKNNRCVSQEFNPPKNFSRCERVQTQQESCGDLKMDHFREVGFALDNERRGKHKYLQSPKCNKENFKYTKPINRQSRVLKDRNDKQAIITSNRKRSRSPIFTRQVYLDEETILVSEDEMEKLPTFVDHSFGNIDLKLQSSKVSKSTCKSKIEGTKIESNKRSESSVKLKESTSKSIQLPLKPIEQNRRKNFESSFKLGPSNNHEDILPISCIKTFFQESPRTSPKKQHEIGSGKKTNFPYIKDEFKIAEPKTQLTNILYPDRRIKQPSTTITTSTTSTTTRDKKTFLNVISKAPKRSLFTR